MKGFPIPVPANLDPVLMKRLLNLGAWRARELPDLPYARWEEERVLGSQSTAFGRVWTLGPAGMRACGHQSNETLSADASLQYLYRRRLHSTLLDDEYVLDTQLGRVIMVYRRDNDMHYAIGSVWGYKAASIRAWIKRLLPERMSGVQLIIAHPKPKRVEHYEDKKGVHFLQLSIAGEIDTQPEDPTTHAVLEWRMVDGVKVPLRRTVNQTILKRLDTAW